MWFIVLEWSVWFIEMVWGILHDVWRCGAWAYMLCAWDMALGAWRGGCLERGAWRRVLGEECLEKSVLRKVHFTG